jgi:hypothetical protein
VAFRRPCQHTVTLLEARFQFQDSKRFQSHTGHWWEYGRCGCSRPCGGSCPLSAADDPRPHLAAFIVRCQHQGGHAWLLVCSHSSVPPCPSATPIKGQQITDVCIELLPVGPLCCVACAQLAPLLDGAGLLAGLYWLSISRCSERKCTAYMMPVLYCGSQAKRIV